VTDYLLIIEQKYRLRNHFFHDIWNVQKFITQALIHVCLCSIASSNFYGYCLDFTDF